jgi:hypothetical protein
MLCVHCKSSNLFVKTCERCGKALRSPDDVKDDDRRIGIHLVHFSNVVLSENDIRTLYAKVNSVAKTIYKDAETFLVVSAPEKKTNVLSPEEFGNYAVLAECALIDGGLTFILNIPGERKWKKLMSDLSLLVSTKMLAIGELEGWGEGCLNVFKNGDLVDGMIFHRERLYSNEVPHEEALKAMRVSDDEEFLEKLGDLFLVSRYNENWPFDSISDRVLDAKFYG